MAWGSRQAAGRSLEGRCLMASAMPTKGFAAKPTVSLFVRHGIATAPLLAPRNDGQFTYGTADGESFEEALATLGKPWSMEEPGIYMKRWPCCYCNHRPVAGMIRLIREHGIRADV